MITGLGVDIVDLKRIDAIMKRHGNRFLTKIFSSQEVESPAIEEIGGKFAAKEALVKALGTGFSGIRFKDIEVLNDERGKPYYRMSERAARSLGVSTVSMHLSISHEKDYAVAVAVLEKR